MTDLASPPPADTALAIRERLERGRTELLDLSTRNRLIHLPRSRTAKLVEVVDERTDEVFRLLVTEGRALTFAPGRQATGEKAEGDEADMPDLAQPDEEPVDERGVAQRHSDTRLQTRLTSEGLQKRLLTLHLDARTLQEEQGVNILYLAMGALRWYEAPNAETERIAPLVLVPVSLERGTAAERFRLRWLPEEPSPNLSLSALLRRQFGITLPEFVDGDQEGFHPTDYLARVAQAVSGQPRWQVLPDSITLGLFSFAKFLMYRDLDPATWPAGRGLADHPLVSGLLGDGFPGGEPLLGEDEPIDPHIPPEAQTHIVDADSSQAAAIHEVRQGRDLVIQGPPGTGKSQTIANVIASAVVDGKTVLFVAEKMAALEVVKRRLDAAGVGDTCLELHSNKASKRAVLEELRRTWELGRPSAATEPALLGRLRQSRDALNSHAARLHRRHEPSGLSPYQVIGHLVRLRQAGHPPASLPLEAPEGWAPHEVEERARLLRELAARVTDMGTPAAHPWRGVGLPAILPTEVQRLVARVEGLRGRLATLAADRDALAGLLGVTPQDTLPDAAHVASIGSRAVLAPDAPPEVLLAPCWSTRLPDLEELVAAGEALAATRQALAGTVTDAAWDTDLRPARQHIAQHGASWLRWLSGDYKRAMALLRSVLSGEPPKPLAERLSLLDRLIAARKAADTLSRDDALGREAFGPLWRRDRSDWPACRVLLDWMRGNGPGGESIRQAAAGLRDRDTARTLTDRLSKAVPALSADLQTLFADLRLDLGEAFGADDLASLPLAGLADRLALWAGRPEDLSKWAAYRALAAKARAAGLGALADALATGALGETAAQPAFEMAYFESLLSVMARQDPDLAAFDGDGHTRLVAEFATLDRKRLDLARLEVATAHHARRPNTSGAAGPVGVLKGELARKRGHMPIRQLMRKAGPAIQALKPVFMMSPLSVAQFLEPGAVEFDLLVVDEASQIQPVDALGAIARCRQLVVVGDDRQLPPTSFFAKVLADDDTKEEDGTAGLADVESILGLCSAKGLPQRMLRWHYRSRHQSLIAVSNAEFYENKLFVVPSPYAGRGELGLRFHHLPHGSFDSGNTGINAVEAKAVAEAIIRHAREQPHLSLGVATFSTRQRRAVVDELELLRRQHPETEPFFTNRHPAEPFFVKNLENVQGDERDVVFISVGYGRNPQGYMAMRFGPLATEGGERRLNVLISRAKRRCEVFASITDEDIDLERAGGRGVAAFKLFLHFARTGKLSVGQRTGRGHDSVFEEQVARALADHGHEVHPQVGLAGFFIDLAVADPDRTGRYVLGIECDGAAYHSSRSARDRDRLRQAVLEDHGWLVHRIWSTDWFNRPQEQLRRTLAAIDAAKAALAARDTRTHPPSPEPAAEPVLLREEAGDGAATAPADALALSVPYVEARLRVPTSVELHELPVRQMAEIARQVVEAEGPVHQAEIVARIRGFWGLQRAGTRIQAAVEKGLWMAAKSGWVVAEGEFYAVPGAPVPVRDRAEVASAGLRKPEALPPAEIRAAALAFVTANLGATLEETVTGVARLLGFKATSAQLRQVIGDAIAQGVAEGRLTRQGDLLAPPR